MPVRWERGVLQAKWRLYPHFEDRLAVARLIMARTNPFTFIQEVRQEVSKVVWPSRRETTVTTIMVFIMVFLAAIFFLLADQVLGFAVGQLLTLGR